MENKFLVQNVVVREDITTSSGLCLKLCDTLNGGTGRYANAATWTKEEVETCKYYMKEGDYTIRLEGGHGFSSNEDGKYIQYKSSEGNIRFACKGASYIVMLHGIPENKPEVILFMDYDFFNSGMNIAIAENKELESLVNTYKEFVSASKDLPIMPKSLRKALARQLASGEISKEKFDQISSEYATLQQQEPKQKTSFIKVLEESNKPEGVLGTLQTAIDEACKKIECECQETIKLEIEKINTKLEIDISDLKIAADEAKKQIIANNEKHCDERKEEMKQTIVKNTMEVLMNF